MHHSFRSSWCSGTASTNPIVIDLIPKEGIDERRNNDFQALAIAALSAAAEHAMLIQMENGKRRLSSLHVLLYYMRNEARG